jgi:hypothetical protein
MRRVLILIALLTAAPAAAQTELAVSRLPPSGVLIHDLKASPIDYVMAPMPTPIPVYENGKRVWDARVWNWDLDAVKTEGSTTALVTPLTIHGHPQLAAYTDTTQYPSISTQCHWTPHFAPVPLGSMLSQHIHLDPRFSIYANNAGEKIQGTATIKAFHFAGQIDGQLYGELVDSVTWDETGTSTAPALTGVPDGLAIWTLHATIDPFKPGQGPTSFGTPGWWFADHGWSWARLMVRARFDDGAHIDANQWLPFWSIKDETKPERPVRGGAKAILESECDVFGPTDTPKFGNNLTEYDDYIPLAAISAPWTVPVSYYSYQSDTFLPTGTIDQIMRPDFHSGILGTTTMHQDGLVGLLGGMFVPTTFDPAVMGPGTSNMMQGWTEAYPPTGEQMSVLSVISVTVGDSTTPPPPTQVAVPNTVGLTQAAASSAITGAGLMLGAVTFDPTQGTAGTVLSQSPAAGTQVNTGSVVNLVVSSFVAPPPKLNCTGTITGTSIDSVTITVTGGTVKCGG